MNTPMISLVNCENKLNLLRGKIIHRVEHELEAAVIFLKNPTASNVKDAVYLIERLKSDIERIARS